VHVHVHVSSGAAGSLRTGYATWPPSYVPPIHLRGAGHHTVYVLFTITLHVCVPASDVLRIAYLGTPQVVSSSASFTTPVRSTPPTRPVSSVAICMPNLLSCPPLAVGWRWLNVGSAGIAGLALVYNVLLPTPPLQKAKQKSEGLSAALCSAEFAGHAWTAFNMGWSLSVHIFVVVLTLKQTFGFSPRSIGFCFLLVPAGILPTVFLLPHLTRRFGLHACITAGCLANVVLCALLSLPDVHSHSEALILGLGLSQFITMTQFNANQARAKIIATKYAKNATGAVTGVSRTCFAVGQAMGPFVSGLIWSWSISGPYLVLAAIQLSQIVLMMVTRTPLWRDPVAQTSAGTFCDDLDTVHIEAATGGEGRRFSRTTAS